MLASPFANLSNMAAENYRPKNKRVCSECGSDKTRWNQNKRIRRDGTVPPPYPQWYDNGKGGWWCKRCHSRLVDDPKWNPSMSKIHNPRRLTYKGKVVRLEKPPRIGVCNWCRAVIPFDCERTQMHHEQYDDDNPLAHTIEICPLCHIYTKNFDTEKMEADREYRRKYQKITERDSKGRIVSYKYDRNK